MRELTLPRLSQGMESGVIVRWLRAEGEGFEAGDVLYELDTDKATQEVEAANSGVLLRILVPEGEQPVGATIAYLGEPDVSGAKAVRAPDPPRRLATPRARRLAREMGLDIATVTGTKPGGRVTAADVARSGPSAAPAKTSPRTPATSLPSEADAMIFLEATVERARLDELLAGANRFAPEAELLLADYLVRLTARAIDLHPQLPAASSDQIRVVLGGSEFGVRRDAGLDVGAIAEARRHHALARPGAPTIYDFSGSQVSRAVATLGDGEGTVITFSAARQNGHPLLTVAICSRRDPDDVHAAEAFMETLVRFLADPATAL